MLTEKNIKRICYLLFDENNIVEKGWSFVLDPKLNNKKSSLYTYNIPKKIFYLPTRYTNLSEEGLKNIILMFVADVKINFCQRGEYWERLVRKLGGNPEYSAVKELNEYKWELICPSCGKINKCLGKPRSNSSCIVCDSSKYNPKFKLTLRKIEN